MPLIVKRGRLPAVPHTEFEAIPGVLALEEIHGTVGFSGPYSRKMHVRAYPTELIETPVWADYDLCLRPAPEHPLQPHHLLTGELKEGGDPQRSRTPIVFGPNTVVSAARPIKSTAKDVFFRNGEKHELYFVQEGEGVLSSEYGELPFRKGHYVSVPKATTYRIDLTSESAWFLVIESAQPIVFPAHYINSAGQAKMMAPVVETEVGVPELKEPRDEKGRFTIEIKQPGGRVAKLTLGHHPFDLCGWEGALYPFTFDIHSHHAVAREIHTAPPMHETFESGTAPFNGFSVCSFVPQMEGWHPKEVPAPYAHYNVDSDEVMFFSNASYGARKGFIVPGSFTFHPGALPHSPQGQAALRSLEGRAKISRRLAVMLDTFFESLQLTEQGWKLRDPDYVLSWHKAAQGKSDKPAEPSYGT